MNEAAMEEWVVRLRKELNLSIRETEKEIFEQRVEIDRLRLELAALKSFLSSAFPSFGEQFPQILEKTVREVDPEFG